MVIILCYLIGQWLVAVVLFFVVLALMMQPRLEERIRKNKKKCGEAK